MLLFYLKPVNHQSFQHPVVEDAPIIKVGQIVRDFQLAVVDSIATAEIEPIVGKLR